jgi:hypothetical protein
MTLRLILVASLAGLIGVASAEDRRAFILSPTMGAELLKQCSRSTPEDVDGFWAPTTAQIDELEALLVSYLRSTPSGRSLRPLEQYHRQYVGFIKLGKRYIYGSFYAFPFDSKREATEPIVVCDGGSSFWGVVFSVESKAFTDLSLNGVA